MREDQLSLLLLLALGAVVFVMLTRTTAPPVAMQRYINEEVWQIERDSRGYISNVTVHRDATST
jgi:hypothetical protein